MMRMMRRCLQLVVAWCMITSASAVQLEVNRDMRVIAMDFSVAYTLLMNEKPLSAGDEAAIRKAVDGIIAHIESLESHLESRNEAKAALVKLGVENLRFVAGEIGGETPLMRDSLAQRMSTVCWGCHTQDTEQPLLGPMSVPKESLSATTRAEFYYATRQYSAALDEYVSMLQQPEKLRYDLKTVNALERILLIYVQIQRDPQKAIDFFATLTDNPKLNRTIRSDLLAWQDGLHNLMQFGLPAYDADYRTLKESIELVMGDPVPLVEEARLPEYIWLRGLVYDFLNGEHERGQTAEALYWLGRLERGMDYGFYFAPADNYLKVCIMRYADTGWAEPCFEEYEHFVQLYYSGSSGLNIPDDVMQELNALRKQIEKTRQEQ